MTQERYDVRSHFDTLAADSHLTAQEAHIFRLLHNIPSQPMSLAQIADTFEFSKARAEQYLKRSIQRIQKSPDLKGSRTNLKELMAMGHKRKPASRKTDNRKKGEAFPEGWRLDACIAPGKKT